MAVLSWSTLRNVPRRICFHRESGKPALHEIQPGSVRGRVVEARTLGEPVADQRRFVSAVIVHDDVHVEVARDVRVNEIEKFAKSRRPMPLMKLRDHLARLGVQRGKQGRRAVAFIVMRPAFHVTGLQWQQGLRALRRLDLRLLVDAEHGRVRQRIQIQPDDVAHFLDELGIIRQLERLAPMLQGEGPQMRLIAVRLRPTGLAISRVLECAAFRCRFQRAYDHVLHLLIGDRPFRARAGLIVQSVRSVSDEPPAPFAHAARCHVQTSSDHGAVDALRAREDDPRAREHRYRSRPMRQRVESPSFVVSQKINATLGRPVRMLPSL